MQCQFFNSCVFVLTTSSLYVHLYCVGLRFYITKKTTYIWIHAVIKHNKINIDEVLTKYGCWLMLDRTTNILSWWISVILRQPPDSVIEKEKKIIVTQIFIWHNKYSKKKMTHKAKNFFCFVFQAQLDQLKCCLIIFYCRIESKNNPIHKFQLINKNMKIKLF